MAKRSEAVSRDAENTLGAWQDARQGASHDPPFPPAESAQADVSFVMPWIAGTTKIVLRHNSSVLDTKDVSSNNPSVEITNPTTAVAWAAGSEQTLTWTADDADGDPLTYSILYSYDGGIEWALLDAELTETSFTLEVDSLAGSSDGRFRVVATDGVNIGFDETDEAIVVPNKAPTPYIMEPTMNKLFLPGALVVLLGGATDLEDGSLVDAALTWSSDRDGELGIGTSLPINTLTPGPHLITLTARDSLGVESTATVNIFVGDRAYLPVIIK